jgi:hypothetical protein
MHMTLVRFGEVSFLLIAHLRESVMKSLKIRSINWSRIFSGIIAINFLAFYFSGMAKGSAGKFFVVLGLVFLFLAVFNWRLFLTVFKLPRQRQVQKKT